MWKNRSSAVNRSSPGRFLPLPHLNARTTTPQSLPRHPRHKDRFTAIQSQPGSPLTETSPLVWFVKEIDINDGTASDRTPNRPVGGGGGGRSVESGRFGTRPAGLSGNGSGPGVMQRTRSRHECHFARGSALVLTEGEERYRPRGLGGRGKVDLATQPLFRFPSFSLLFLRS